MPTNLFFHECSLLLFSSDLLSPYLLSPHLFSPKLISSDPVSLIELLLILVVLFFEGLVERLVEDIVAGLCAKPPWVVVGLGLSAFGSFLV
jgi:hypothetical protein